jgi:hypothetical protein
MSLEFSILIPTDLGAQRRNMSVNDNLVDALEIIYEALGCLSLARKPTISYKLSTATVKSLPINLASEDDWKGLIEDVIGAHAKKSKAAQAAPVSLSIIVPEQVWVSQCGALVLMPHCF